MKVMNITTYLYLFAKNSPHIKYHKFLRGCVREMMEMEDLAKKDGFKSAEEMFKFFDEDYDLSIPKKFYVYRWDWE